MDKERQRQIELAALKYYNEVYSTKYSVECNFTHGAQWADEHPSGWHDLMKDPNDFPKEFNVVIISIEQENGNTRSDNGYYDGKRWWVDEESEIPNIIAWMKLPEFTD